MDVLPAIPDIDVGAQRHPADRPRLARVAALEPDRLSPTGSTADAQEFLRLASERGCQAHGRGRRSSGRSRPRCSAPCRPSSATATCTSTDSPKDRPASIIITTLAARAYTGRRHLYEVLADVTAKMPDLVEVRNGLWVANPVQPEENFADRWRSHPGRAQRFFEWMEQVQHDVTGYGADRGVDRILKKLAETFGQDRANRAGERLRHRDAAPASAGCSASAPARARSARRPARSRSTRSTAMRPDAVVVAWRSRRSPWTPISRSAGRADSNALHLERQITPTPPSRATGSGITYRMRQYPKVRVLAPELETRPGESLPHVFNSGTSPAPRGRMDIRHADRRHHGPVDVRVVDRLRDLDGHWSWYGGGQWPPLRETPQPRTGEVRPAPGRPAAANMRKRMESPRTMRAAGA